MRSRNRVTEDVWIAENTQCAVCCVKYNPTNLVGRVVVVNVVSRVRKVLKYYYHSFVCIVERYAGFFNVGGCHYFGVVVNLGFQSNAHM